ncbi:MAG: N-acetyltransferase [Heliobacteriaceae bacterium]|nr:N-acetyltransferase [Heliobacteriaceae bacterium]MDD4587875.1 N-acetyltransferase [Heliobacteriaceae bacterium]
MTTTGEIPRISRTVITGKGYVHINSSVAPEEVSKYRMDLGLDVFRPPEEQKRALMDIAALPEGRVVLAVAGNLIIGYVTFHPPEEFARWAVEKVPRMMEMGAIEVSRDWRNLGLSAILLATAFADPALEDYIVIATEYYWHWDLKGKDLSVWEYQKMLEWQFGRVGLCRVGTDEPDILAHPANMLMARVGSRVPFEVVVLFEDSLYQEHWMF